MSCRPVTLLLPLALAACEVQAPETPEQAYHEAMTTLLRDNAELSRDFQYLAAEIKKEGAAPDAVAKTLRDEILPDARELAEQVAAVQPGTPALAEVHPLIVEAWETRVGVYQDVLAAWKEPDPAAIEAAEARRYQASRATDRYFTQVNEVLVPAGYALQPFPAAPAAPSAAE